MRKVLALGSSLVCATALLSAAASAQQRQADPRDMGGGACENNVYNCAETPNPLPAPNTVWIEEMTWMDVRDALEMGTTTAIIPSGGMEPNGPWLVTGKHNYVLRANCDAIARELGDALCAPIIKWVPEGSIDPPSSHMTSPGTISLREESYRAMLTDVASSLKAHGFKTILFIGDSGGNQGGQRAVAEALTAQWNGTAIAAHIQEYYDYGAVSAYMETQGLTEGESDGLHDDVNITLNMFYDDPSSVRYDARVAAGLASINGVSIADRVETLDRARKVVDFRAWYTVNAIHAAMANGGTIPVPPRPARAGGAGGRGGPGGAAQRPAPNPRTMGGGQCDANPYNCSDTANPLPPATTMWMEEMTWMDVRDALQAGKTTAIISTGGMEPNGPWLVTGKHNYVLKANCAAIAQELGNAVCAPVLPYVPEGSIDPPSGHMRSPGTISLQQETFEAVLTDIANSLRVHGFENIVFIGDSGGNQGGQERVAEALNSAWSSGARAHHVGEYYRSPEGSRNVLREKGVLTEGMPSDGLHDDPTITMNMMLSDIESVRWTERVKHGQANINGVSLEDLPTVLGWAREISQARAERTAEVIRQKIAAR